MAGTIRASPTSDLSHRARRGGALATLVLLTALFGALTQPSLSQTPPSTPLEFRATLIFTPTYDDLRVLGAAFAATDSAGLAAGCEMMQVSTLPPPGLFVGWETINQNGCAAIRLTIDLPRQAHELAVTHTTDRNVSYATNVEAAISHRMHQDLTIMLERQTRDDRPAETFEAYTFILFEPNERSRQPHTFRHNVTAGEATSATVTWTLADLGPEAPPFPRGHTSRAAFSGATSNVRLTTPAVPLDVSTPTTLTEDIVGREAHLRQAYTVTPPPTGARWNITTLQLPVLPGTTWQRVVFTNGETLALDRSNSNTPATMTTIAIDNETAARVGTAGFTLEAIERRPITASFAGTAVALILTVAPLVAATTLGRYTLARKARTEPRTDGANNLPLVVAGAVTTIWTAMALVTLVTQRGPLVATWPLGAYGFAYYGIWGASILSLGAAASLRTRAAWTHLHHESNATRERAAELETFLHGATHDLKTPLIALDWLTQDLENDLQTAGKDPAVQDTVARIRANVGGMENLVQDLLALAQADAGTTAIDEKPQADASVVLAEVLDALDDVRRSGGHAIDHKIASGTNVALAPSHLRMVLTNLVGNALRYGRAHEGTVRILATGDTDGGCATSLIVEDDGPGVPMDDRERIFQVFQRGEGARQRNIPGTGLGLALVARILRNAGGDIRLVDSELAGARFEVRLPSTQG